jgi:CHAD domain-containing protein
MTTTALIELTDTERQRILELAETGPEQLMHRARLILGYAAGMPTLQAAAEAEISRGRARFWKRQFTARRMEIFEGEESGLKSDSKSSETAAITSEIANESVFNAGEVPVTEMETEIPFPLPREKIGIVTLDPLAEAGKKVWSYYFAVMLFHEAGTIEGTDIEELHDMRVATRRMRTAFDVFGPAFDPKVMQKYLRGLRKIGRELGGVRDMDVILENAVKFRNKMIETLQPGFDPLVMAWQHTIDKRRVKMIKYLQGADYQKFIVSFNHFLHPADLDKSRIIMADSRNPLVQDSVPALVYSRYAAVRAYESIIPMASIPQLHALRIEFKKFRYTLEYFKEVLGKNIGKAIAEIKEMQDHLGELHDADVACQLVKDFLAEWETNQLSRPVVERQSTEPIVTYLAYLHAERYRLANTFPELWIKFSQPEFRQILAEAIALL